MNRTTKRAVATLAAGATIGGVVAGATASPAGAQSDPTIVETVLAVSGAPGTFDTETDDYDLLREALLAANLTDGVQIGNDTIGFVSDVTVFAPNDGAFLRLARDLGFTGSGPDVESAAFGFLAEATGYVSPADPGLLDDVLLYHVAPGAKTVRELRRAGDIPTALEGSTVDVRFNRVVDGDPNDRDARIRSPRNLEAADGIIHTVNRVLRPIDLEPAPAPAADTVLDVVLQNSGTPGEYDQNSSDFDLLREAVLAADLDGALADADADYTVLAPTDSSFIALAYQLGYRGGFDEEAVFGFLAEATNAASDGDDNILDDVLLTHVLGERLTTGELRNSGDRATLSGVTLDFGWFTIGDADPDAFNPFIVRPNNIEAGNGIVHTIFGVLRPIDL